MDLKKQKKRGNDMPEPSDDWGAQTAETAQFDYTAIANAAVSDMRAQAGDGWGEPEPEKRRSLRDLLPSRKKRAPASDNTDDLYDDATAADGFGDVPEQGGFLSGKRRKPAKDDAPTDGFGDMPEQGGFLAGKRQKPAKEDVPMDGFGDVPKQGGFLAGKRRKFPKDDAPADGFGDMPEQGGFLAGKRRKPTKDDAPTDGFGDMPEQGGFLAGKRQKPAKDDALTDGFGDMPEQGGFLAGKRRKFPKDDAPADGFGDMPEQGGFLSGKRRKPAKDDAPTDGFDEVSYEERRRSGFKPTPEAAAAASPTAENYSPNTAEPLDSGEPQRRRFNAAEQPNYPEPPIHQKGGISALLDRGKASINKLSYRMGRDDPNVDYYTPPAGHTPSDSRRRQKRRNRTPWPMWLKAAAFGAGLLAATALVLYLSFYIIITGRINYVGDVRKTSVRLTVAEQMNMQADKTVTEENAAEFTEPLEIAEPSDTVKVVMVVSSDSRLGANSSRSAKTDAIMLVAIDPEHKRLRIASIMSDTYVRIQDYYSNKLSKAYYYDTANGDFTLTRLRQAVKDNFGVVPDNYVIVDFEAFQRLITRLGGVEVDVTADEAYYMSAHKRYGDFPRYNSAGRYNMNGPEALNYIRMRAVGSDDYDRTARQRKVFIQIMSKLGSKSSFELAELAYAILPELPTDLTASEVFGYLNDIDDISEYEINELTVPITNSWRYGTADVRGQQFTVIVTNFQFNATVLQSYLYRNDDSYLNGLAATDVTVPQVIAPLAEDSPAGELEEPEQE